MTNRHVHRRTYMLHLSVWCLFVAYIMPKSRTERPRKTKIGTEVAHVTRDLDTTFKVKRSKVKVTRLLYSPLCWHVRWLQRWAWETAATLPSAQLPRGTSAPTGEEERGELILWQLPAYSLFILTVSVGRIVFGANCLWGKMSVGRKVLTPSVLPVPRLLMLQNC